jgi:hypothetical protein
LLLWSTPAGDRLHSVAENIVITSATIKTKTDFSQKVIVPSSIKVDVSFETLLIVEVIFY